MEKKNKLYLLLVFVMGFIVFFIELHKTTYQEISLEMDQINWWWVIVAIISMFIHWVFEARILQTLLKRDNNHFSFRNAIRIPLIEHVFNSITPMSTGGQPAQVVALSKSGVDPGVAGSVSLMKFAIYQVMIVFNFILCVIFGFKLISGELVQLSFFIVLGLVLNIIVVTGLMSLMFYYPLTNRIVDFVLGFVRKFIKTERAERFEKTVKEKMHNFYIESQYMRHQKKIMIPTFILTMFELFFYYIVPYFILLALNIDDVDIIKVIVLHAFIIMVISLFPVPGGSGGAEYTFSLLFGTYVTSGAKLVMAVLLWRVVTLYVGIIFGMIALMIKPKLPTKDKIN